ncbi:hypothetical protein ILUMI_12529 [Ignelater luminosus]|uniref:Reverse transcriptase domain-containing protein n=1 Tax=Ignelater luminosus TaxID=2038154 RepID=A0A8K0CXZ6_IGNLU|nr:hypothetical protein ILUMI_12529 [Ignelater luminosus]
MKPGKAAGHYHISPEMVKYLGSESMGMMLRIYDLALTQKKLPDDWKVSIIVPKGNRRDCRNYRSISLLSVSGKVYCKMLERRLPDAVKDKIDEMQCGFRGARNTQDLIFSIRQFGERAAMY